MGSRMVLLFDVVEKFGGGARARREMRVGVKVVMDLCGVRGGDGSGVVNVRTMAEQDTFNVDMAGYTRTREI